MTSENNKRLKTAKDFETYLIWQVKLDPKKRYSFLFEDGTGFYGTANEFGPYAERRFKWNSSDTYEIMDDELEEGMKWDYAFEIYPPSDEGEEFMACAKKDWRF